MTSKTQNPSSLRRRLPGRLGATAVFAVLIPLGLAAMGGVAAGAGPSKSPAYTVRRIASGAGLSHRFTPSGAPGSRPEALSRPDDITQLGGDLFVAFQNGVGPQGEPSPSGNTASTIVSMTMTGRTVRQWDVEGKVDGLTGDPGTHQVIATVNEDGNSSLYTIAPGARGGDQVRHFTYSSLTHGGGTDAISILGQLILISASAPAPSSSVPQPAVYAVSLAGTRNPAPGPARTRPMFEDQDRATVANTGSNPTEATLALTDPDSSEVVPEGAARFGGDFMLTSQGDQQQIYVKDAGRSDQALYVLNLTRAVDDTAWPTGSNGTLYSTDTAHDTVDVLTGPFQKGRPLAVATPCGSNSAPSSCPAPGYPANFLAGLDQATGQVAAVAVQGVGYTPQGGLLFVPGRAGH